MFRIPLFALLTCAMGMPSSACASDNPVVVVVNAHNPLQKIGVGELKNLFTGNIAFWQGTVPVTLIVRASSSEAGARFLDEVLGSTPQRFEASWQARQLAGRGVAPRVAAEAADVAAVVAKTPGAIGYILTSEVWTELPAGVKVLSID